MKRLYNVEMSEYTSFRAGGCAAEMVIPAVSYTHLTLPTTPYV